ncbi:MAG: ATP-dependent helicase HrpB [Bacteroidales bacterium]|nr:ATP-dependent helicase HrpB [Bacteroidales bacterium]
MKEIYPIEEIFDEVYQKYLDNQVIIITAPTGTGKSTVLPLEILKRNSDSQKIVMLEPRRLAAKAIAFRMADLIGQKPGKTVGYTIRFENCVSKDTRLEVVTEGVLTRRILADNELKGVSTVIFDEFHERNLNTDLTLALVREAQQILRDDLKIIIMSATIDAENLSKMLNAPVISATAKNYNVEIFYEGCCDEFSVSRQTALTVLKALERHPEGDILAFLPGEGEIRKCEEFLKSSVHGVLINPLYGMLPPNLQQQAIMPDKNGRRKIVLATSIAETSLTIQGVKIVVDSGLCKIQQYSPDTGLSGLKTVRISLDMAQQRAGRAGRVSDGFCYRLWDLTTQDRMLKNRLPEIEYADLTPLMLDLIKWGEPNPENLTWLTPPDKTSVNLSKELLKTLEAVDDNYFLTPLGEELSRIPSHPRIAKMLVQAQKYSLLPLASDIAAILDNRDPLPKDYGTDINLRIERLRLNRREKRHNKSFDRIELYAMELRKMFKVQEDNSEFDSYDTGLLLAESFPERIASAKLGNNAQFMLSNGTIAMLGYEDSLAGESWLAVAALNAKEKIARIFLASPLNPVSLKSMLREKESVLWNTKKGGIVALKQLKIGSMVLQEKSFTPDSQEVEQIVLSAVKKEGEVLLDFNDEVINLQNRILSLRIWNGEDFMPDVSTKTLIETAQDWLLPYLSGVNTVEKLKKIDIFSALKYSLTPLQQRDLEKLAPAFLEVPTGHKIKLKYSPLGLQPVLAVRLQEVFSWQETPKINGGKVSVLMHLLSPGFKPVQVTSDLKSFWQNAYKEVRKELKRRYPKHQWPEL